MYVGWKPLAGRLAACYRMYFISWFQCQDPYALQSNQPHATNIICTQRQEEREIGDTPSNLNADGAQAQSPELNSGSNDGIGGGGQFDSQVLIMTFVLSYKFDMAPPLRTWLQVTGFHSLM